MGRTKRWAEDMQARFPEGTFARIATVLRDGEDRTDFVRAAVDNEIAARQGAQAGSMVTIASADCPDGRQLSMVWRYDNGRVETVEIDIGTEAGRAQMQEIVTAAKLDNVGDTEQLVGARFRVSDSGEFEPI